MLFYTIDGKWVDLDLFACKNDTTYYKQVLLCKRYLINAKQKQSQDQKTTLQNQKNFRITLNSKNKINNENT